MKESYNTRFFQFFLVLALTIIVSETVLTHVSYQAYARETESEALVINEDSAETGTSIESALGKPRTLSVTLALKAESQGISRLASPARPVQPLSHNEVQAAAEQAQEALEETKTEKLSRKIESKKYHGDDISAKEETPAEPVIVEPETQPEPEYEAEPEYIPDIVPEEEPDVQDEEESVDWEEPEEPEEPEPEYEPEPEEPEPEPEPEPEAVEPEEPEVPEEEEDQETSTENYTYLGEFKLTAYCPCAKCCGHETGITATGTVATEGRTIAVNPNVIPYGSVVYIEGYGTYIAEDTGGFGPSTIDIFFNSHDVALQFGVQYANVYIVS